MTLKELSNRHMQWQRQEYPNMPEHALPRKSYSDRTSSALATAILDYCKFNDVYAIRRSNEGRYRPGMQVVDVIGRTRIMKGRFIPAHSTGEGDIEIVYKGKKIEIEIKIGSDKQRDNQIEHQAKIEKAGGLYFIVKSWPAFWEVWCSITNPTRRGRSRLR